MHCFATVSSKVYLPGTRALINSVVRHANPSGCDMVVISHDLDAKDIDGLKEIYPNIRSVPVNAAAYQATRDYVDTKTLWIPGIKSRFASMFFKFDLFELNGYEKVVCLDSDTIVVGDISLLVNFNHDFGAVMDHNGTNNFNSGVMVIGKRHLGRGVRDELMRLTLDMVSDPSSPRDIGNTLTDQGVLNAYFRESFQRIPQQYNFFRTQHKTMGSWLSNVRIIHFVHDKPWENERHSRTREADDMVWDRYRI